MNFPAVPNDVAATSTVLSGLRIETSALLMVTLEMLRLMLCPAVPAKVAVAFSFATVVVTVTAAPPGTIVYEDACALRSDATQSARVSASAAVPTNQRFDSTFTRTSRMPQAQRAANGAA